MSSENIIKVGTRGSNLALWQTNHVINLLKEKFPNLSFEIVKVSTSGDLISNKPLFNFDQSGVFTKELDNSLISKQVDITVHSLKDIETEICSSLKIGAVLERDYIEDALILKSSLRSKFKQSNDILSSLSPNSIIGTSSIRRKAFLKWKHPKLLIKSIRGNVDTRLRKLEEEDYSAIVLSSAGLKRLQLDHAISQILNKTIYFPAVSQGVIAIMCRKDDFETISMLKKINHFPTQLICHAERSLLKSLGGGCRVPLGVFCQIVDQNSEKCQKFTKIDKNQKLSNIDKKEQKTSKIGKNNKNLTKKEEIQLKAMIVFPSGKEIIFSEGEKNWDKNLAEQNKLKICQTLGEEIALKIKSDGGEKILKVLRE